MSLSINPKIQTVSFSAAQPVAARLYSDNNQRDTFIKRTAANAAINAAVVPGIFAVFEKVGVFAKSTFSDKLKLGAFAAAISIAFDAVGRGLGSVVKPSQN